MADLKGHLHFYDLKRNKLTRTISLEARALFMAVEIDTNMALLDMLGGKLQLIDLSSGDIVARYENARVNKDCVTECAFFGNDSSFILASSENGKICVWDRLSERLVDVLEHAEYGCVNLISVNPIDQNMFISTGDDCKIRLWMME